MSSQWDAASAKIVHANSKATIAVVNGEPRWDELFSRYTVRYCQLQTAQWYSDGKEVWVTDRTGTTRIDAILWRVGAIRLLPLYRSVLEIIRFTGLPSVNPAETLLRCFDRLSMYNEMKIAGLPLLPQQIAIGHRSVEKMNPNLPCVIKVGNFHAGYGKARATSEEMLADLRDLVFAADDYVTAEPFVTYRSDIRCLAIGSKIWAMKRKGAAWKANTQTVEATLLDQIPDALGDYTTAAMRHLRADIVGLDFLEDEEGKYWLLECNDTPGLSGFPEDTGQSVADCLKRKMS